MTKSRKDAKGRNLKNGEYYRIDGRYSFRYNDIKTGKRLSIYANDLPELREKEKELQKDVDDAIQTSNAIKKMSLNTLFERYLITRDLAESTLYSYKKIWHNLVENEIGNIKVQQLLSSHLKSFYLQLSKKGYSASTIKFIQTIIYPALEMALDDDIIRKNPAKFSVKEYGVPAKERIALTFAEQQKLMEFVRTNSVYKIYYPMLVIMLGTGLRCGELIGLTWADVDMITKKISIDHQLIYKKYCDDEGYQFHITDPKSEAGNRKVPMTDDVDKAFKAQKALNNLLDKDDKYKIDGYTDFIFLAKTGRPLMPSALNFVLTNIVKAYNKRETELAALKNREIELLPNISAHVMRHTACTRMAERGMDIKVLQYIMGHSNVETTMNTYYHINDLDRVLNEIEKVDVKMKEEMDTYILQTTDKWSPFAFLA